MNIDNCDLNVSLVELGNNFKKVGEDFLKIKHVTDNECELNFSSVSLNETECGTVACHGGWGVFLYSFDKTLDFESGAELIEKQLGFDEARGVNLAKFASDNPEIWGNHLGLFMFGGHGYRSFGFHNPGVCTIQDIGNHYIVVGNRILEHTKSQH